MSNVLENISLFVMLGLLASAFFISYSDVKKATWVPLIVFSILYVAYSSGRVGGVDTPGYRLIFGNEYACLRFESSFSFLCGFDSPSGFSFLFFLSSVLLLFTAYRLSTSVKVFAIVLLILFPLYFVIVDMGYVRQSIATSIIYLFCFNEERKRVRYIGYVVAPFFHLSSLLLIFFFELLYSKKYIKLSFVFPVAILIFFAVYKVLGWIDADLMGLIGWKDLNVSSIAQLVFLLTLNFIAARYFRWRARVTIFTTLLCLAGYFGHLYRVYLMIVPIIALGIAHFVVERKMSMPVRFMFITAILIFGFAKLNTTVIDDGSYDIPWNANSLFWFL